MPSFQHTNLLIDSLKLGAERVGIRRAPYLPVKDVAKAASSRTFTFPLGAVFFLKLMF